MEPLEANMWKIWLDAIENPDWSKAIVALRGVDYSTDKIQRRQTAQGEIYGFMSTVLTKNQGSYTRRLRSLATNRIKNGDTGSHYSSAKSHGKNVQSNVSTCCGPEGFQLYFFTYNVLVLPIPLQAEPQRKSLMAKLSPSTMRGMLAARIDSRRMVPNLTSFHGEAELLTPLIIFPDEVVKYHEGSFDSKYTQEMFLAEIEQKTGVLGRSFVSSMPSI